uniref:Uncharacterized protein n=2 Tax=Anguilla anguilla TaxID=7936 RepID=A0A0E9TI78_ANGAN
MIVLTLNLQLNIYFHVIKPALIFRLLSVFFLSKLFLMGSKIRWHFHCNNFETNKMNILSMKKGAKLMSLINMFPHSDKLNDCVLFKEWDL